MEKKGGHRHMSHHCLICGKMVFGGFMCKVCRDSEAKRLGIELEEAKN